MLSGYSVILVLNHLFESGSSSTCSFLNAVSINFSHPFVGISHRCSEHIPDMIIIAAIVDDIFKIINSVWCIITVPVPKIYNAVFSTIKIFKTKNTDTTCGRQVYKFQMYIKYMSLNCL